jgi:hypothetical protein
MLSPAAMRASKAATSVGSSGGAAVARVFVMAVGSDRGPASGLGTWCPASKAKHGKSLAFTESTPPERERTIDGALVAA